MSRAAKIKVKKTRRSVAKQSTLLRSPILEAFFFFALALFGFTAVSYWLGMRAGIALPNSASSLPQVSGEAALIYEVPSHRPLPEPSLSPVFTPSVQYWEREILQWAAEYEIDPNLIATVMQIESCGNPRALSPAGAAGLFQVMPYHFAEGEDPFDPDTNARRGLEYLSKGLELSGGHAGLALASYNGGHSIIGRKYETWSRETQRYYRWGSGIYREASAGWDSSPTLAAWLAAGGQSLCEEAEAQLGLLTAR